MIMAETMMEYHREFQADVPVNPMWRLAVRYWIEYFYLTEAYDRTVCSGERAGLAVPINGRERALIETHAKNIREGLLCSEEYAILREHPEMMRSAKDEAARWDPQQIDELYYEMYKERHS